MSEFQPWTLDTIIAELERLNLKIIIKDSKPALARHYGINPDDVQRIIPHLAARRDDLLAHFFGVNIQKTDDEYAAEVRQARLARAVELAANGRLCYMIGADREHKDRGKIRKFNGSLPDEADWLLLLRENVDASHWERLLSFSKPPAEDESCPNDPEQQAAPSPVLPGNWEN